MPKAKCFEELEIWKLSIELSIKIYEITKKDNIKFDFGLKDQIQRASVSVSSNVAEGFEYNNNKQFIKSLWYSKGSLGEVRSQLYLLNGLKIIDDKEHNYMIEFCKNLSSKIFAFIRYLEEYETNNKRT